MKSLTIRNIPNNLLNKIKILSEIDRRSINSEILYILENSISTDCVVQRNKDINRETQVKLWNRLSGEWKDKRKTEEIISDIYSNRSTGRDFSL